MTDPERRSVTVEPMFAEPTLDQLWQAVVDSMAAAEADKLAIYRGGVPAPEALDSIQKHIDAGLAARVMYERLRPHDATEPAGPLDRDTLTDWLIEDVTAERATRGGNVESRESFAFVATRLLSRLSPGAPREDERLREAAKRVLNISGPFDEEDVDRATAMMRGALDPEPSR